MPPPDKPTACRRWLASDSGWTWCTSTASPSPNTSWNSTSWACRGCTAGRPEGRRQPPPRRLRRPTTWQPQHRARSAGSARPLGGQVSRIGRCPPGSSSAPDATRPCGCRGRGRPRVGPSFRSRSERLEPRPPPAPAGSSLDAPPPGQPQRQRLVRLHVGSGHRGEQGHRSRRASQGDPFFTDSDRDRVAGQPHPAGRLSRLAWDQDGPWGFGAAARAHALPPRNPPPDGR